MCSLFNNNNKKDLKVYKGLLGTKKGSIEWRGWEGDRKRTAR
jgi:hypothetical protein